MLVVFCNDEICAQLVMPHDVIINEILFNPAKEGFDYVEVYNRSNHAISLNDLMIANRNGADEISSIKNISKEPISISPGDYFILTANEKWLRQHYNVPHTALLIPVSSLPSFPDDEGSVVLLRKSDTVIIDDVKYSEQWHFKMLSDPEGVALERINYDQPAQEKNNWMSASSSSGYGTPGTKNSQFIQYQPHSEEISVLPKVFTPDNDGQNDLVFITIKANEQGKLANAVIFDITGRRVRYILKNELLGADNRFVWDGYDDRGQRLPTGIYIINTHVFDLRGNVHKYKNCIVLSTAR